MDVKNLRFIRYAFLYIMSFRRKRPLMNFSLHILILTYTYVHTLTQTRHRSIAVCAVHIQTNLIDKSFIPLNKIRPGTNRVTSAFLCFHSEIQFYIIYMGMSLHVCANEKERNFLIFEHERPVSSEYYLYELIQYFRKDIVLNT